MPKMIMTTARILMGLIFLIMGINGFVAIIPMPEKAEEAQVFFQALERTGYFWPFEKLCEILFGAMLLLNRWVVLAVEGLAPIIANIMLFHIFLDWPGMPLALVVFVCEVILISGFWKAHIGRHFRQLQLQ